MAVKDYQAAAMDCGKALSLLTPPVEANARSRLIAHSRRAAALAPVVVGCAMSAVGPFRVPAIGYVSAPDKKAFLISLSLHASDAPCVVGWQLGGGPRVERLLFSARVAG